MEVIEFLVLGDNTSPISIFSSPPPPLVSIDKPEDGGPFLVFELKMEDRLKGEIFPEVSSNLEEEEEDLLDEFRVKKGWRDVKALWIA